MQTDLFGNVIISQNDRNNAWCEFEVRSNIVDCLINDFHTGKYNLKGSSFTSYHLCSIALCACIDAYNGRTDLVLEDFKPVESILDDYVKWKFKFI